MQIISLYMRMSGTYSCDGLTLGPRQLRALSVENPTDRQNLAPKDFHTFPGFPSEPFVEFSLVFSTSFLMLVALIGGQDVTGATGLRPWSLSGRPPGPLAIYLQGMFWVGRPGFGAY